MDMKVTNNDYCQKGVCLCLCVCACMCVHPIPSPDSNNQHYWFPLQKTKAIFVLFFFIILKTVVKTNFQKG